MAGDREARRTFVGGMEGADVRNDWRSCCLAFKGNPRVINLENTDFKDISTSDSKGRDPSTAAEVSEGLVVVKHRPSKNYSDFISCSDFFLDAGKISASSDSDFRQG